MYCTVNTINFAFDKEQRIKKAISKKADGNAIKLYTLASFIVNQDFINYVKGIADESYINKGESVDLNNLKSEDFVKFNNNKLSKLLNDYYKILVKDVKETATKGGLDSLNGFSSQSAQSLARDYVATKIVDTYRLELLKPKEARTDRIKIIKDIIYSLEKEFNNNVINPFVKEILTSDFYSKEAKQAAKEFDERLETVNSMIEVYNANIDKCDELRNKQKQAKTKEERDSIVKEINDINKANKELRPKILSINSELFIFAQNIANNFANETNDVRAERIKNFANLVIQAKGNTDEFFFRVFNTKRMTEIIKDFNNLGNIAEQIEEQDANEDSMDIQYNNESIDETSKSWEDNLYKSYMQSVSTATKIVLSTLHNLSSPYNDTVTFENQMFDTNNELGVTTYMDIRFVINQIKSLDGFTDVNDFIKQVEQLSTTHQSKYGIGILANIMKHNKELANMMFVNFSKPVYHKTMLKVSNIADQMGIDFDFSNDSAFPIINFTFEVKNRLMSFAKSNGVANFKERNDELYKTIKELCKTKEELVNKKLFDECKDKVFELYKEFNIPIDRSTFEAFINKTDTKFSEDTKFKKGENLIILLLKLKTLNNSIETYKENINKAKEKLDKYNEEAYKKFKEEHKGKNDYTKFVPRTIDYYKLDDNILFAGAINLAKDIVKYMPSRLQLNTVNAEGHSASDVGKNNYISRFFNEIKANDESTKAKGLKTLREYFNQGEHNQYEHNSLLQRNIPTNHRWVTDENGKRIGETYDYVDGLEILDYNLFDGSKNTLTDNGLTYSKLSKIDFFLTQYIAYWQGTHEWDGREYKRNGRVYAMRIPSDAPKIFFIKARGHNNLKETKKAIYGHVLDEINMFSKGIGSLFVNENGNYYTTTKIDGLFERAFFDVDEARTIRQNGETDYTKAIVKDGKLRGNLFKFLRLCELDNYKADEKIESALSLYGQGNEAGLFIRDGERLMINPTKIQDGTIAIGENGKLSYNIDYETQKKLMWIVNDWADAYVNEAMSNMRLYFDYMLDIGYTKNINTDDISQFLLDTYWMNINFDDLFEGDFKFYKNARDFLKRTKESQAGGDGYAGYDTFDANQIIKENHIDGKYNNANDDNSTITTNGSRVELINVKQSVGSEAVPLKIGDDKFLASTTGFRAVTIYNTVSASQYADEMQKELERIFLKQGYSKEKAKERSNKIAEGYWNLTKTNDAQSYITLEEFIRRRYLDGTLNQYQDLLAQIYDPKVKAEDIDLSQINARIQVQKNFYYDKVYDPNTGLYYPRQIKNAEFVLIPKLLPEGSKLKEVYEFMKANNIDQLNTAETSKAANKDVFTIFDEKTGNLVEGFQDTLESRHIQEYSYKYLYKQQEVPQHMADESNKAGAQIIKKILDNIQLSGDEKLKRYAREFQQAFTANIEESAKAMCSRFGWTIDETTGKIVNKEYEEFDENGERLPDDIIQRNRENINLDYFYSRLREEAARLGQDSNFFDYIIPAENGMPLMPAYMNKSNIKLQNVTQSIFNSAITRQMLPGWHAAQITDVGYDNRLRFDAKTGVMEVYLPRWSKLIPKGKNAEENKAILAQIEKEGLDIQIGYRMPTEAKCSVSVIKVVGFTNDALGSTIVVPQEWVTQTGSDFDVDSVYGICWEMYAHRTKDGKIELRKIEYEEDKVDDWELYVKYVQHNLETRVKKDIIGNEIKDKIKDLKDELFTNKRNENNKQYQEVDKLRNEYYKKAVNGLRRIVIEENAKKLDLVNTYNNIINRLIEFSETHKDKLIGEKKEIVDAYIETLKGLVDIINAQHGKITFDAEEFKSKKGKIIADIVEKNNNIFKDKIIKAAKDAELMSFDEFKQLDHIHKLDNRARNNFILDRIIKIMNDDNSREEQYGRSQFEDITNANKFIDNLYGDNERKHSPYSILDQLDYFEDVTSGARLKAISVTWDNFVSRNNWIMSALGENLGVDVILNVEGKSSKYTNTEYNENELRESYDVEEIKDEEKENETEQPKPKRVKVHLNKVGWSNNNRNIVGRLVTSYSAETTSHTLDAVKEGSIPNVNEYTFGVYKLLTTLGLDYEHTIAFIRQPIITRLVRNNNSKNSLFATETNSAIIKTLQDIYRKLGNNNIVIKYEYKDAKGDTKSKQYTTEVENCKNINTLIDGIVNQFGFIDAVKKNYGIDITNTDDVLNANFPIILDRLLNRIVAERNGNKNEQYEDTLNKAVDDFVTLMTFYRLQKATNVINKISVLCGLDKVGAKQTIFETRRVIEDIEKLRDDKTLVDDNGVSFMDKVFPKIDNIEESIKESAYPSMNAIYRYVTRQSVDVNSKMFITDTEDFYNAIINNIENAIGRRLTAKQYQIVQKYAVATMYNASTTLLSPLRLNKKGEIEPYIRSEEEALEMAENRATYWNAERSRVLGYGVESDGYFEIKDINNPTKDEMNKYLALTPAQKVLFMQRVFKDNAGIFNYIKINIYNYNRSKTRTINRNYLTYADEVDNPENFYDMFVEAFSNKNPLIRLAAIDLVKYAFLAEQYDFKYGAITKIISNKALYRSIEDKGMNLVNEFNKLVGNLPIVINSDEFVRDFARSHSNMFKTYIIKRSNRSYNSNFTPFDKAFNIDSNRFHGMINIDVTTSHGLRCSRTFNLFNNVGRYINIANPRYGTNNLYHVLGYNPIVDENNKLIGYKYYTLIPLNKLDNGEFGKYSYNVDNNSFAEYELYKQYADINHSEKVEGTKEASANNLAPVGEYKANGTYDLVNDSNALTDMTNSLNERLKGGAKKLIDGINQRISDIGLDQFSNDVYLEYNPNYDLFNYMPKRGSIIQTINHPVYGQIDVEIKRIDFTKIKSSTNEEYNKIINELNDKHISPNTPFVYKVTLAKPTEEEEKEIVRYANTELIESDDNEDVENNNGNIGINNSNSIDRVSNAIIRDIRYHALKDKNAIAKQFMDSIVSNHIDYRSSSSITANREHILVRASRYYKAAANSLYSKLNSFEINGVAYKMSSPDLYKALIENDEYFGEISSIILDSITFGKNIEDILNLDITTESKEIADAITEIRNAINLIRNNDIIKQAMDNMFNIYYKKYATNPNIMNDLMELKETYGDMDTIIQWIHDPTEHHSEEVQVVLNRVYTLLSKAEMFDAKKNVDEFVQQLEEIKKRNESLDLTKFIDMNTFSFKQEFNEEFLKDREQIFADLVEASKKGFNTKEYILAKYKRDKFLYEHTNQVIVDNYYKEKLENEETAMKNAGNLYFEYISLCNEIQMLRNANNENNSKRLQELKQQLRSIRSKVDENGNVKSAVERDRIDALNIFIKTRKEINKKYFNYDAYDGFIELYQNYKDVLDYYNNKFVNKTLEEKLQIANYAEAYNWIKNNGSIQFDNETKKKITKAFDTLTGSKDAVGSKAKGILRNHADYYDEHGVIDARKFTDEEIEQIKHESESVFGLIYSNGAGDGMLYKLVPDDIPSISSKRKKHTKDAEAIYAQLFSEHDNVKKYQLFKEINSIIGKAINIENNTFNYADFFNDDIVTNEEREKLIALFKELQKVYPVSKFAIKNKLVEFKMSDKHITEATAYYLSLDGNSKQAKQFKAIFKLGSDESFNPYLYGYLIPKDEFIDVEKTEARKFIKDNIEFVPTEYYEYAKQEAINNGTYEEWFRKNHVYNPYTHKYEPLRIWTKLDAKPGSSIANNVSFVPVYNNVERSIKDEYKNDDYNEFGYNYKKGSKYDVDLGLNKKEEAYKKLIEDTLEKYTNTYQGKRFIGRGFLPRERKANVDAKWVASQLGNMLGLNFHSSSESDDYNSNIGYNYDRDGNFDMLNLIKAKGSKQFIKIPEKNIGESDEQYAKRIEEIKAKNKEIEKANLAIDNMFVNNNLEEVMKDFVHNATIFNARAKIKPHLYMLLEDLRNNNAYMLKGLWNKEPVKDTKLSTRDNPIYREEKQDKTYSVIENLTRRLIYDQYHKNSSIRSTMNLLQNITSAKYMIFNVYGGIANIATGKVNIGMEESAKDYFGFREFQNAEIQYLSALPSIIASSFSETSNNITVALLKKFNVVEIDNFIEHSADANSINDVFKNVRNSLYILQSGGEHYMQNSVLLAMLKSNRIYTDNNGKLVIGDFKDYVRGIEENAMIEAIKDNSALLTLYKSIRKSLKNNTKEKYKVISGKSSVNEIFLNTIKYSENENATELFKKVSKKYQEKRDSLLEEAQKKFISNKTIEELFDVKDGYAIIKDEFIQYYKKHNPNANLDELISKFREKVISVNKFIHGVYDKKGSAMIENTWFGSLLMQYHKHLPMGILKRWRRRGYYNEFRQNQTRGTYQSVIDFLGIEFQDFKNRKQMIVDKGTNECLASIQVAMESCINSIYNITINYNNLDLWQKANIRRNFAEIRNVFAACLLLAVLYAGWDDDEIKDSTLLSSALHCIDRLYSETTMYSPIGLGAEYKTMWSSPIAAYNSPSDFVKGMGLIANYLFDPEFDPIYRTGQYAGQNKATVLIQNNIPGVRAYRRIANIQSNNKYYKIGNTNLGMKWTKNFMESIID